MNVCIAAACENGATIVSATDGLIGTPDASGESVLCKMIWFGPWQFMYAGRPDQLALIKEEISYAIVNDADAFSRRRVIETTRAAYQAVKARYASFGLLSSFDMTIGELKSGGLQAFGEAYQREVLQQIQTVGSQFNESLIVTGWGHAPHAAMIYEIGPGVDALHDYEGFAAIGSGANVAVNTLLLLDQGRHRLLSDTIFNVACAKFASEKASGVGKATTIYVSKKAADGQSQNGSRRLPDEDVEKLRSLWEAHLRPRIPDEARADINVMAAKINDGQSTVAELGELLRASQRLQDERSNLEALQRPQQTTASGSRQQP